MALAPKIKHSPISAAETASFNLKPGTVSHHECELGVVLWAESSLKQLDQRLLRLSLSQLWLRTSHRTAATWAIVIHASALLFSPDESS